MSDKWVDRVAGGWFLFASLVLLVFALWGNFK
jgi:hypothetical protein